VRIQGRRGEVARELWQERLSAYLGILKKSEPELRTAAKDASWKVAVAAAMKTSTTASPSNDWEGGRKGGQALGFGVKLSFIGKARSGSRVYAAALRGPSENRRIIEPSSTSNW
jgi:hypothetical protein